jgi:curved DNA-binding protein CbpA
VASHYELLGVAPSADAAEVRRAYARIARERHPDRFTDPVEKARAEEFFKEATAAYNALSNPRSRSEYDAELATPKLELPEEIAADAHAKGMKLLEARDLTGAVELFRRAVYNAPQEARYHAALGRALARDSRHLRDAILALEQAARLSPQQAALHADLAILFQSQGLNIRARKAAEMALALAPQDPRVIRLAEELGVSGPDAGPPDKGGGLRGILRRKP